MSEQCGRAARATVLVFAQCIEREDVPISGNAEMDVRIALPSRVSAPDAALAAGGRAYFAGNTPHPGSARTILQLDGPEGVLTHTMKI